MSLYKGYIEIKDKKATTRFKNKSSSELLTLREAQSLPEYGGVLNEHTILIDIDDKQQSEILLNIVDDLGLRCRVIETGRGKHFLFYLDSEIENCKTHTKLAVGLDADIKIGSKATYEVLKLAGVQRAVVYDKLDDEEYQIIPRCLFPIKSNKINFLDMSEGEGRNQSLFNYILTLQSEGFPNEDIKQIITLINKHVLSESLPEEELSVILRDEAFSKPSFYKGKTFLHDVFARWMAANDHIININGRLHIYKDGIYKASKMEIENRMIKYIPSLTKAKRQEVMAYLESLIVKQSEQSPPHMIAFLNGILNIYTNEFTEFSPDKIFVNRINCNYNPAAYNADCDRILNNLSCHNSELRHLLCEMVGYCFFRRSELRKCFLLVGEKRNGKSTFLDMVLKLLGEENTSSLDLSELNKEFKTAELVGKLANVGDDISDNFIPDAAVFKKLVSGNRMNVARKFEQPFDFSNYAKFIFSANNIPRIKDKTGAVLDRMVIIPFNASFTPDDPDYDPFIKDKVLTAESLEYLTLLGVEALKEVLRNRKFTETVAVEEQIAEYEKENNPVLLFFEEIGGKDNIAERSVMDIYAQYKTFCIAGELTPVSKIEFGKQVKKVFNLTSKNSKVNGKSVRIYVEV